MRPIFLLASIVVSSQTLACPVAEFLAAWKGQGTDMASYIVLQNSDDACVDQMVEKATTAENGLVLASVLIANRTDTQKKKDYFRAGLTGTNTDLSILSTLYFFSRGQDQGLVQVLKDLPDFRQDSDKRWDTMVKLTGVSGEVGFMKLFEKTAESDESYEVFDTYSALFQNVFREMEPRFVKEQINMLLGGYPNLSTSNKIEFLTVYFHLLGDGLPQFLEGQDFSQHPELWRGVLSRLPEFNLFFLEDDFAKRIVDLFFAKDLPSDARRDSTLSFALMVEKYGNMDTDLNLSTLVTDSLEVALLEKNNEFLEFYMNMVASGKGLGGFIKPLFESKKTIFYKQACRILLKVEPSRLGIVLKGTRLADGRSLRAVFHSYAAFSPDDKNKDTDVQLLSQMVLARASGDSSVSALAGLKSADSGVRAEALNNAAKFPGPFFYASLARVIRNDLELKEFAVAMAMGLIEESAAGVFDSLPLGLALFVFEVPEDSYIHEEDLQLAIAKYIRYSGHRKTLLYQAVGHDTPYIAKRGDFAAVSYTKDHTQDLQEVFYDLLKLKPGIERIREIDFAMQSMFNNIGAYLDNDFDPKGEKDDSDKLEQLRCLEGVSKAFCELRRLAKDSKDPQVREEAQALVDLFMAEATQPKP